MFGHLSKHAKYTAIIDQPIHGGDYNTYEVYTP